MLTRDKGEITVACDDCGSEEYSGVLDFAEFIQWLKEQGWKIRKDGDVWTHTCGSCEEG